MKQIDDSLEWHDENELVRRLDVVEAILNLADTIDDVVDVIMSVPTYKVQTSTNIAMGSDSISTKADRKTETQKRCDECIHFDKPYKKRDKDGMIIIGVECDGMDEPCDKWTDEPQTDCAWR